jgi:hypothetical protein
MRTFQPRRSPKDHLRIAQDLLRNVETRLSEGKEKGTVLNVCMVALTNVVVGLALDYSDDRRRRNNQ